MTTRQMLVAVAILPMVLACAHGEEEPQAKTITLEFDHKLFAFESHFTLCREPDGTVFIHQAQLDPIGRQLSLLWLVTNKDYCSCLMREGRMWNLQYVDFTRLKAKLGPERTEGFIYNTIFSTMDGGIHPKFRERYFGERFKKLLTEEGVAGKEKVDGEELDKYVLRPSDSFERTSLFSRKDGFLVKGTSKIAGHGETSTKRVSTGDKEPKEMEAFRKFIKENEKTKEDITDKLGKDDDKERG